MSGAAADVGKTLRELRTPCAIVDLNVAQRNADTMLARASALGCMLRPHVKTHKTVEGALLQTGGRRSGIVVSTMSEAKFFATAGFDDILYAVPISPDKLPEAAALLHQLDRFHVLVDHVAQLQALHEFAENAAAAAAADVEHVKPWSIFVMVDCGYHRDGVDPNDPASVKLAVDTARHPLSELAGIYTHGGHAYGVRGSDAIVKVATTERDAVCQYAEAIRAAGVQSPVVAVGSTPTCSHPPADLRGVTEMHPGNYLLYDMMQANIGSCGPENVAARVATRVIGHYPNQNMLLVDLGWTGCSAQGAEHHHGSFLGHPNLRLRTLKQEAGEVDTADGTSLDFERFPIGSVLLLLPWHSCASCHPHENLLAMRDDRVVEIWRRTPRGW